MKPTHIALGLSVLLVSVGMGKPIDTAQTETLTGNQTADYILKGGGFLTLDSTGTNQVKTTMFGFNPNAGAIFNVNNGTLDLDLSIANAQNIANKIDFHLKGGSTLKLTAGQNGRPLGVFAGSNTTLATTIEGNSTLKGSISNDGTSTITIGKGSKMQGDITQTAGALEATIDGNLEGSITSRQGVTETKLWSNKTQTTNTRSAIIKGGIITEGGNLIGILKGMELQGSFIRTGGTADIAFWYSDLQKTTTLSGGKTTIHFYNSTLQTLSTTGGNNTINLKVGSKMQDYIGSNSTTTLELIEGSTMKSASQSNGALTIKSNDSKIQGSITATNATLHTTLSSSKLAGSLSNSNGTTKLATSANSTITGNITQTNGSLEATLQDTTIEGGVSQIQGTLTKLHATNTKIKQGIAFTNIRTGNIQHQVELKHVELDQGYRIDHLAQTLNTLFQNSTITGGINQLGIERAYIAIDNTTIEGGIAVRDGNKHIPDESVAGSYATDIYGMSKAIIKGGITSDNHAFWMDLRNASSLEGGIIINGGTGSFKIKENSQIVGDLISQNTKGTHLFAQDRSTFTGSVTQTNGKQEVLLDGNSTITGSITNYDAQSVTTLDTNSKLEGTLTQNRGTLMLGLGGGSTIEGSVLLNKTLTKLNNGKTKDPRATIKGDLTQNEGDLSGWIKGLTLHGTFSQNGGTSNVKFDTKSNFAKDTSINNATASKVTFDHESKLKNYTINNSGKDNSLKLDHLTILDGNFTLNHSSSKLSVLNQSKITGNVTSTDPGNELELDIGQGGTIGGDVHIENGKVEGKFNQATIGGNLILVKADSHFHFFDSTIKGNIDILKGTTLMTLDGTKVGGYFKMKGNGPKDPTLKLKISNASSIGGNLTFDDTQAFIGGEGLGSQIKGSLISTNSTLTNGGALYPGGTGAPFPLSGLTILKDFTQTGGTLDLTFANQSHIKGKTTFSGNTAKSHLTIDKFSTLGTFEITGGTDNLLTLKNNSTQTGNIALNGTKITISALNKSTINGDITATAHQGANSDTTIILDGSKLTGAIKQENPSSLTLNFSNHSAMTSDLTTKNLTLKATLESSSIIGDWVSTNDQSTISLSNGSLFKGKIQTTNTKQTKITANASIIEGEINHNNQPKQDFEFLLTLTNASTLNNTKTSVNGNLKLNAENSTINSEEMTLTQGKLDITLNHSFGTIKSLNVIGQNNLTITTLNASDSEITKLTAKDTSTLKLIANTRAIIKGELELKNTAQAIVGALGDAQIHFDITPDPTSTLQIGINGGMLVGKITQANAAAGEISLASAGNGGRWLMTDDSKIRSLSISNPSSNVANAKLMLADSTNTKISMVDMTKNKNLAIPRIGMILTNTAPILPNQTQTRTLTLDSLKGSNGVFRVYTDVVHQLSDKLVSAKAEGRHIVQVYYDPKNFSEDVSGKRIVVASISDPTSTALFEGGTTNVGTQAYKTDLIKVPSANGQGFDWIIGKSQNTGPNFGTKVISSILQSQYRAIFAQFDTLNQRLGELRDIGRVSGLWARYSLGKLSSEENQARIATDDNYYSVWAGYDQNSLSLKGQNFIGFAFNYTELTPENDSYRGSLKNIGFNFYDTFLARNDFYFDIVAKYVATISAYSVDYFALSGNEGDYTNHKFLVSAEIGQKFKLGDSKRNYFFLQPEAQILSGYVHYNDLTFYDLSGTKIDAHLNYYTPVILRAGLNFGRSLDYAIKGDVHLGSSLIYEVNTGGNVLLDDGDNPITYQHKGDIKAVIEFGTNLILNDSARLHFEATTSFFGKTNITYGINAGVRFTFGYKNTRQLRIPEFSNQGPIPNPDYDPRNMPIINQNTQIDIRNNLNERNSIYNGDYFLNTRKAYRDDSALRSPQNDDLR
ncbi:hypothetical protein BBW65_02170 [Helicobacter enhydrae]|uniref:Autotransporter domain-containing protein n=1 Tax=Helicobacter enhydrae TaxID=222136 RepID=A0A1B1U4J2_9HELI|nr:autotransporter outer membrane beta-barrel domain-containing protein [Helicobacter enhydrae]ANV97683.1 hypothetical protein BBW65_02170 [Helicobacter enhydrae]